MPDLIPDDAVNLNADDPESIVHNWARELKACRAALVAEKPEPESP